MTEQSSNSAHKKIGWLSRGVGSAQLGVGLAAELVEVVERMHGNIAKKPLPWAKLEDQNTKGITGFVYGCVKAGFKAGEWGLQQTAKLMPQESLDAPEWLPIRAAANGVFGDLLADQENPQAIRMAFVAEQAAPQADSQTLLLFIHGLCMSELGWQQTGHIEAASQLAEQLNARVAYLRYNSGLHISENGDRLADLLEDYSADVERIVVVGHSMGGLLTRSACYYAEKRNKSWLQKLTHVATLGTPHDGAPLERLGNWANTRLKLTPYTQPLARLGNLRSAGIRDLRHGAITHEHWLNMTDSDQAEDPRDIVARPTTVRYLLLAGTRSVLAEANPLDAKHDLLVTVASAWDVAEYDTVPENTPAMQRELFWGVDHMQLMYEPAVYQKISGWL